MADQQALTPFDECADALIDESNALKTAARVASRLRTSVGNAALSSDALEVEQDDDGSNVIFHVKLFSDEPIGAEQADQMDVIGARLSDFTVTLDKSRDYRWFAHARIEVPYR